MHETMKRKDETDLKLKGLLSDFKTSSIHFQLILPRFGEFTLLTEFLLKIPRKTMPFKFACLYTPL